MSVLLETTKGNLVVDLFIQTQELPCYNFLKLCQINHYFFSPFYKIENNKVIYSGDPNYPSGVHSANHSINKYVELEQYDIIGVNDYLKVDCGLKASEYNENPVGLVSFTTVNDNQIGSEFSICLDSTDPAEFKSQLAFGKVVEGFSVLQSISDDTRIIRTHIIHDPFPNPPKMEIQNQKYFPSDIQISNFEENESSLEESTYQALGLELMNDLPHYNIKPSPRTLFIAKLNPITTSESLEIIFARFGEIVSSHVIIDAKTAKSLCYGFVEFSTKTDAEKAYGRLHKGCIIDGRNVIVEFSQSARNAS